jgi:hypothetical protein
MPLPETEYSYEFDKLRENRCGVSFHKYGSAKENFGHHLVSALDSAKLCHEKYLTTGNTEYLVDQANYIMYEFMYPSIEGAHFRATSSDESAGVAGITINRLREMQAQDRAEGVLL